MLSQRSCPYECGRRARMHILWDLEPVARRGNLDASAGEFVTRSWRGHAPSTRREHGEANARQGARRSHRLAVNRMDAVFDLTADEQGRFWFTLKGTEGEPLLVGLKSNGRIPAGIDVLHVRKAVRDIHHFIPHLASDGAFVVLKDTNGEVLAKSPHVPKQTLKALVAKIQDLAPVAGIHEDRPTPTAAH